MTRSPNGRELLKFAKKYGLTGKTLPQIIRAISRYQPEAGGLQRKPCKRGHTSKRLKHGHCAECWKLYQREYQRAYMRKRRATPLFRQQENKATRERMRRLRAERM